MSEHEPTTPMSAEDLLDGIIWHGDHDVRAQVAAVMEYLCSRLNRLQAIVDKLPKTGDGMPVVPGMEVWVYDDLNDCFPSEEVEVEIPSILLGVEAWSDCYSTKEAAEAAAKERTDADS